MRHMKARDLTHTWSVTKLKYMDMENRTKVTDAGKKEEKRAMSVQGPKAQLSE
jgi:hypothetical protein